MSVTLQRCFEAIFETHGIERAAVQVPINAQEREARAHLVALALETGAANRDRLSLPLRLPPVDVDTIAAWHMCLLRQSARHRDLYARARARVGIAP